MIKEALYSDRYYVVTFYFRPFKDKEDLQEFTEPDCTDIDGVKPFCKGHDRYRILIPSSSCFL